MSPEASILERPKDLVEEERLIKEIGRINNATYSQQMRGFRPDPEESKGSQALNPDQHPDLVMSKGNPHLERVVSSYRQIE